jgi:hypothetical protein
VRILVQRKKTGDTYGVIDFVYGDRPSDVIKTHVKENKLSTGDVLLKESINAIVRYDEDGENQHTPNTQPIVFLEISIPRRERPPRNYSRGEQGRTLRIQQT